MGATLKNDKDKCNEVWYECRAEGRTVVLDL